MSYSKVLKRRAYNLYVISGYNPEQITSALKPEYPKITSNTIRNWLTEIDETTGTTAEQDREKTLLNAKNEALKEAEISLTTLRVNTVRTFKAIKNQIFDTQGNLKVEFKSGEGALNTFRGLMNDIERMLEKEKERVEPVEVARGVHRAIKGTPKLNKFFQSNPEVLSQYIANIKREVSTMKDIDIAFLPELTDGEN
ncbi:hypothetical protein [Leptospira borgpetersenii]|uniref:Uncharacterized protein n=2 Tax=Leptospira borgpetersenii TaxID=174 RepID=M3GX00_LEPBO|nr:hypothetical protein [Leptospira borgpetersenii]EKP13288.1 hypothetical protein LEP1GSC128_3368 [Leptospira borgpetersenii str. 200801926]EMF99373.1 hypothetical protein LEP1GSC123_4715 [Leptospira borgpetersenii str. 200701203]ENO65439.1 hypothetical protein LEP1GSC191_2762 [Leptospira borgpetersenii serovar Mini str. 201000851]